MNETREKVRAIIVEDESLFRDLLRVALSQSQEVDVVGSYGDGVVAIAAAPELQPQVAILDINLGNNMNGVQVGLRLRQLLPSIGILLLSNHSYPQVINTLPPEAAHGWSYLLKKSISNVHTLERAITGSAAGFVVLDPNLVTAGRPKEGGRVSRLTPRQREILRLIAQGYTNRAVAESLVISEKSVENQVNLIYQDLVVDRSDSGVQPRVTAVLIYLQEMQFQP
ncbi:MAG: response regulator transcription factor [Chloroflexi bacterium]|nr:response regulator transcription factor [Chloroflexota bacterium]